MSPRRGLHSQTVAGCESSRRRSSRRRRSPKQRGGSPSDPMLRAAAGQSFVIGDIDFLSGEEGAAAIHQGYRGSEGVFTARGLYEILFIKRRNDAYPFSNGRSCYVSTSGIMALMRTADYHALGGSPQNAYANRILEFIAPVAGIIRTSPAGFTFNGTLLC